LPTASDARTKNVCEPSAYGPNESPLEHCENAVASTWHWNPVAPAELKVNVVVEVLTRVGWAAIVGTGGAGALIVHWMDAAALALPAASYARTKKVCRPFANGPNASPLAHSENAAASTWHSNFVAPAELNVKLVVDVATTASCAPIVGVAGGTVSIVHV
jgi:hypothetical protein